MFLNDLRAPTKIILAGKQPFTPTPAPCCRQLSHEPPVKMSQLKDHLNLARIYLQERYLLWRLRYLLGPNFSAEEFLEGTCQATLAMLEAVCRIDWKRIRSFCTEEFSLTMYGIAQRESVYANLMGPEGLELSKPVHLKTKECDDGRSFLHVHLEIVLLRCLAPKPDELVETGLQVPDHQKIPVASYKIALRRELSGPDGTDPEDEDWFFSSFQMQYMSLLGFCPKSGTCWFIRALKPY
ncbi:uncharacterized protein LOC117190035 [Drosophila miranda]|uniref:uncharacterized protein LOC117190035 n=1 Tax=Drosophila miranda TaxID=7229 RepID=UPI00143F98B3|nr:uncharacterized protein LOC117190035 [Drosophila miranda]